jgi:hypothetical protein
MENKLTNYQERLDLVRDSIDNKVETPLIMELITGMITNAYWKGQRDIICDEN